MSLLYQGNFEQVWGGRGRNIRIWCSICGPIKSLSTGVTHELSYCCIVNIFFIEILAKQNRSLIDEWELTSPDDSRSGEADEKRGLDDSYTVAPKDKDNKVEPTKGDNKRVAQPDQSDGTADSDKSAPPAEGKIGMLGILYVHSMHRQPQGCFQDAP